MPSRTLRSRAERLRVILTFAFAFAMALGGAARVQARGDDAAEARRHAQRASNLAASGKCRQAVAEWNKAMAILRDPALLFNRAECYRKLGEPDSALQDYQQFLSALPKAPNRGEVERRIAELTAQKKDKAPPAPVVAAAPAVATSAPPGGSPLSSSPSPSSSPPPSSSSSASSSPPAAEGASAAHVAPTAPPAPVPSAPVEPAPKPSLALTAPADAPSSSGNGEGGITTRPWFWITIAAVAVAAGVGTFVVLSRDSTNIPSTALGNYKF